jgi:citronellol/citronellal dehydrogenase
MGELQGRVALVTGASRGIGAAVAQRFAAEGAVVALTARSLDSHPHLPGTLVETARCIERNGGEAHVFEADLCDPEARTRVVEETLARLGRIDLLVNNAAAAFYMPFEAVLEKRYRVAFDLNVRTPFDLAQHVLPGMRERRRGWILNISSATAKLPQGPPFDGFAVHGGALLYGATKAALDRISAGLAAEFHADGIAVNSLSPVAAVMTPGVVALGIVPKEFEEQAESVEAMAEASLALCTPQDPEITGRILFCTPLLEELGRPVRTLDGKEIFENRVRE